MQHNASTPSEDEMQTFSHLFDKALQQGDTDLIIESVQQILENRTVTDTQYNTLLSYWQRAEIAKHQGSLPSQAKGEAPQPLRSNQSIRPQGNNPLREEGRRAMQDNQAIRQQFAPQGGNTLQQERWNPSQERKEEDTMDPALRQMLEKRRQASEAK